MINKIKLYLIAVLTLCIHLDLDAATVSMRFKHSVNKDGSSSRFSKIETTQRVYTVFLGKDNIKTTNVVVKAHTIVVSAKGKENRLVGSAEWSGALDKKRTLDITTISATARKDRCRGLYGIDLNDGWQISDIIVEVVDSDKDKVIKILPASTGKWGRFVKDGRVVPPEDIETFYGLDGEMSIEEKKSTTEIGRCNG